MALLQGLTGRQKLAAAGLATAALFGMGAAGSGYLARSQGHGPEKMASSQGVQPARNDGRARLNTGTKAPKTKWRPAFGSININSATEQELDALPGVGPVTARKIVEYRTTHGGFQSIDELDQVKGIGPKKLEEMRPYCRL